MFVQSQPYPEMIELVRNLKAQHELRIATVNNEARELNSHRIRRFELDEFVAFFIVFIQNAVDENGNWLSASATAPVAIVQDPAATELLYSRTAS